MSLCWIWENGCKGEDIAAWVQAVFSVVAIFYSGRLARSAERQRLRDTYKLADIFVVDVVSTIQGMKHLVEIGNAPELNRHAAKLRHAIDASEQINPGLLPYTAVIATSTIRSSAELVITPASAITYGADFTVLHDSINREYEVAHAAMLDFGRALNNKRWWWKRNRD